MDIEYRTAATLEVRHVQRTIDLIAVPYNESTDVLRRGRWVSESVDPGARSPGCTATSPSTGPTTSRRRSAGSCVPSEGPRGLRAELRISRTAAGDDVLELAADGLLSPSIGFQPLAEDWNHDRPRLKVTRAKLVHIALTGDPAYKGAKVLAVRSQSGEEPERTATPNLDRIRLEMLAARSGVGSSIPIHVVEETLGRVA